MKVFFNGFWDGFIGCTDPINFTFFIIFLSKCFNISIELGDIETSDILIESCFIYNNSLLKVKKWKYSFFYTGESFFTLKGYPSIQTNDYSCILGFRNSTPNFVKLPLFAVYRTFYPGMLQPVSSVPSGKVVAVISSESGKFRNMFLDRLEQKVHVTYAGNYRRNVPRIDGNYSSDNLIYYYRQFKFVIAMENSSEDYYITEKILNALRAGIIPVYWGSQNVDKYFNPKRFLWIKNERDFDKIIDRMVSMSDSEYLTIVNEPIFSWTIEPVEETVRDVKILLNIQ